MVQCRSVMCEQNNAVEGTAHTVLGACREEPPAQQTLKCDEQGHDHG